ncbi:SPOR domain-containing protein [Sphingomonas rubra]|uniref:Tetratrico peptide repeat-containing protein n=1 Tax=Sphingomonas rubra TaxID=634430 RepID=A0A1I5SSD7_9SPHN|nr:SPOR domain-containing protein [Sphingomonas rubra]SFP73714.1 Tetratrico peptide repeat-containing protein [Sphingomonas rubra]
MIRHHSLIAALLAATCLPVGLVAQEVVQPLGQTDADLLAAQMRLLASDPRNIVALTTAGELSLRLGDLSGAAALFARADKVDPRSGRVKAGMGSILVRSERPGEALRFFGQAESLGWPVARYAADRGLALDLVGQQERAHRDYRLALQNGADDETARRYALSLGIAGKQAQALEQLDPLVRRQDRAAWRARAFVMAMNGDTEGASKIATTMMPAGMAQGLGAFFRRLPTLPAVDRAFAVHFGEITATPARLADARFIPTFAPLPAEVATPPVQVAAVVDQNRGRRTRRDRTARPTASPVATTAVQSAAAAPRSVASQPVPSASVAAMRESNVRVGSSASTQRPVVVAAARPVQSAPVAVTPAPSTPVQTAAISPARPAAPVSTATVTPPATVVPAPRVATPSTPPTAVAAATVAPTPAPAIVATTAPVAPVPTQAATERADSVLARIVASLSIPASELGVAPVRPDPGPVAIPAAVERVAPSPAGARVVAEASAKEGRDAALRRTVAGRLTGDPQADEPTPATGRRARRGAAEPVAVAAADTASRTARGRRGTTAAADPPLTPAQRRAAERKAAADKKAAAEKKELADKAAAEKKAARSNPARIWVQVAGGANEAGLDAAWQLMRSRAPSLKKRTGYTTPLRATNRVLTGPFKTDAEARTFVNQLRKEGVGSFAFTSEAGQKVERLDAPNTGK